ncbi:MAG: hypothetical protein R3E12_00990 [Candidatus Eisenbacteria bacterium]
MQVVYAAPGEQLRLVGGLGPLQEQSVAGSMTWTFAPAEGGCTIGLTYRVAGRIEGEGGAESWAAPVDFVLGSQLERLSKLLSGH